MADEFPETTIDYSRAFSLPFGLPPHSVAPTDIPTFLADLGVRAEFIRLEWEANSPFCNPGHPRDPFGGDVFRVRCLKRNGASESVLVPTSFCVSDVAAHMDTIVFRAVSFSSICRRAWSATTPAAGETMSAAMARQVRYDDHERCLWPVPQPCHTDDALALFWEKTTRQLGKLGSDVSGILIDESSSHALKTSASARDGELSRDLLRTPVRGLVRVSRYRHIAGTVATGSITAPIVLASSKAGAVVICSAAQTANIPADNRAPLLRQSYLVWDHVDVRSASSCLSALWWSQLLHLADLESVPEFRKEVRASTALGIAIYLALSEVSTGTFEAFSGLDAKTRRKLLKIKSPPDAEALHTAVDHVLVDPARRKSLSQFALTTLGPLLCGLGWNEIMSGTSAVYPNIPAAPASRTAANGAVHALLESAQQAADIWIAVYAGAPIGKPAFCYRAPISSQPVFDIPVYGATTFDLEALVLAQRATSIFPDVAQPSPPSTPDYEVDLALYHDKIAGGFATLRTPESAPGSPGFTCRDWLAHLIKGSQRTVWNGPALDLGILASLGHPITNVLDLVRWHKAQALRTSLDEVYDAAVGSVRYDSASTAWWSKAVGFSTGLDWPVANPGGTPGVQSAAIEARNAGPTRSGETVGGILTPSGFDVEDLDLVLAAREYLRSGHDLNEKVATALVLGLLDREGYRMNGTYMRQGPFDLKYRDDLHGNLSGAFDAASVAKRGGAQGLGRWMYTLQAYGLDLLDVPFFPAGGPPADWFQFAWNNYTTLLTRAQAAGTFVGDISQLNGRMLVRLTSRLRGPLEPAQSRTLARSAHLAGILAQQAEFQRRHALLRMGSTAGKLDRWWMPSTGGTLLPDLQEFTQNPAPQPGASGEAIERREYLAYYALCYLAYNGSPSLWRSWIERAVALGATSLPRFLLFDITDAQAIGGTRELWHRGHFVRFSVALDAYLRSSESGVGDAVFPTRTGWGV